MNDIFFKRFIHVLKRISSWSPSPRERSSDNVKADEDKKNYSHPERNLQSRKVPAEQETSGNNGKEADRKVEVKHSYDTQHEYEEDGLDDIFPKFLVMDMV